MNLPSYSWLYGKFPAEVVVIAGIHGNERACVSALEKYRKSLNPREIKKSTMFILGNPQAYEKNVRYVESDLNREFRVWTKSYEGSRAKSIADAIKDSKILIDLHLTQSPTLESFVISPNHKKSISFLRGLDVPIDKYIISNQVNPASMSVDEYFLSLNNENVALTLELGYRLGDQEQLRKLGEKVIDEALKEAGAIEKTNDTNGRELSFWKFDQQFENNPGTALVPNLKSFAPISEGQVIAHCNGNPITSQRNGRALFPKYGHTTDAYILRTIVPESI